MIDRALLVACAALVACRPDSSWRVDDLDRAGDAGYAYNVEPATSVLAPSIDAGRPSIVRVAGYPGGRGDLDGAGDAARLGVVVGMARAHDALFFADEGNGSIRRFDPATHVVETIARLPRPPDGAPALPAYVAFDGAKTLYVSDRSAQVIYALDVESRALTPFAGALGVRDHVDGDVGVARFDAPTGLAFDGAHGLYVADVGNRRIRFIDLASRKVSTIDAPFTQVWGLCWDGSGLYASDVLAEALYHVDIAVGRATLVAGSGRFGYAGDKDAVGVKARLHGPRGLACNGPEVLVSERWNGTLRRYAPSTGEVSTVAGVARTLGWRDGGARDALFADTQAVFVWDADTIFLGDEGTLRMLSHGVVSTVAGAAKRVVNLQLIEEDAISEPTGAVVVGDAAYVASCGTNTVQRVDLASGVTRTFAGDPILRGFVDGYGTEARFDCAAGAATDGHGHVFVGDRNNHAVRDIDVTSGRVSTVAGTRSVCRGDDGSLDHATFCDPTALVAWNGSVFVGDLGTSTIRKIDLAVGAVTTIASVTAGFVAPVAMANRGATLYVADRENGNVRAIDLASGTITTLPFTFDRPRAIAIRGDELLVADHRALRRIDLGTHVSTDLFRVGGGIRFGANDPRFHEPSSLFPLGDGDVLVVDAAENALVRALY
jgi:sugar lactone lactonase YvrE